MKGSNYRMTHTNDVVPQLPPHNWHPEWDHYYPEYWVNTDSVPVLPSSISVITGYLHVEGERSREFRMGSCLRPH
jgi:triacylglycerol lipase